MTVVRYILKVAQSALPEVKVGDVVAEVQLNERIDARTFEALVYGGALAVREGAAQAPAAPDAEEPPAPAARKRGGAAR